MGIRIDDARRERLIRELRTFFQDQFDEDLTEFRAAQVLDFFLEALGPQVYNQAVHDARRYLQEKLDDLDGEVYEPEGA
ncbi:MAG: DUF2164 domain-containing protein [Gemmatimonadota bacterium]|nr:DUF2164 domain-containing protein [Gemmatimonadota bacterium]MDH5758410.1 DUF2164 domain-containing protein [Gemmatimonadota bacterium]